MTTPSTGAANGTRTNMLWDTENRLTSVTNTGVTETYGYDADGERLTRASGGVTTVYLGGLWETSAGAVKQYYAFNGTIVTVRDSSAGVSYLHGDHLSSVSATTGAQAGTQTFGPWGNVTSGSSSATSRNYTGQYLDSGTGLLYYHARYYDAALARFISADSVVPGQTATSGAPNPQQLNRYSYVVNNPLTTNDPSGHDVAVLLRKASKTICAPAGLMSYRPVSRLCPRSRLPMKHCYHADGAGGVVRKQTSQHSTLVFLLTRRGQATEKQAESRPRNVGMTFSKLIGLLDRYDCDHGAP